jgi:hypothetical protein
MKYARVLLALTVAAVVSRAAAPATIPPAAILVEAENFREHGGWVIDQQFMDQMGSPFLLAHGLGTPVDDAWTEATVPVRGNYHVWVRTRDWVAPWKAIGAPGRFQLLINGKALPNPFGTEGARWHWQYGGSVPLDAGTATLALHDLTGFDGRCDAIVLTTDVSLHPPEEGAALAQFRAQALRLPEIAPSAGNFDLVVVGGGMAGTTTAISAARLGLKVALIQDRAQLGGNNSSEVRVALGGNIRQEPYPALGAVVAELDSGRPGNARPAANYDDEKKLGVVRAEPNIRLFFNTRAVGVEKTGNRIAAVVARDVRTGSELKFAAPLFADCTGDGSIGYLAGADYHYGRESRGETGEPLAPETADRLVMGASIMWYSTDVGQPVAFPETPWALQFSDETAQKATRGDWDWETGQRRDQVEDFEAIRDHALRAVYGNWSFQKNHGKDKSAFANLRLEWVAYIAGKRESRRLLGDVVLRQQDIQSNRAFPDAAVTATWSIDLHEPEESNAKAFPGEEFRSVAHFGKKTPYAIPYRCLYSRNIENLFMAGRDISVTHVALGTVRVMRTTGMMGEVVGMAASVAHRHSTTARGVYQAHLEELKRLMNEGVGKK